MKNPINISLACRLLNVKRKAVQNAVDSIESETLAPKYMIWGTGNREYVTKRNLDAIEKQINKEQSKVKK